REEAVGDFRIEPRAAGEPVRTGQFLEPEVQNLLDPFIHHRHSLSAYSTFEMSGTAFRSIRVYASCGLSNISSTGPCSTSWPLCMTPTSSAIWRTTARL